MIEQRLQYGAVFTGIAALIVSTVLNILYRGQYFLMGVNFIYNYQTDGSSKAITVIQNLISILGNTFFIVAFLLFVHLLSYRKLNTIVYIFYIVINAYFIAVQKQAFQDPRPFFYNTQIQALEWTCPRSYGFPSGHSWVSVLLYEPIFADMIGTKGYKKIALLVAVLTGVLIPISRQYLGSHTADQVTSGVLHSLTALVFYRYFLHQKVWRFLNNICLGLQTTFTMIVTTIIFIFSIAVPFIIYGINTNHREFNPNFIASLNVACSKATSQDQVQKEAGTAAAIIGLVFGIIYGLVIANSKQMEQSLSHHKLLSYLAGSWNFGGRFLNVVKFILIYIVCGGITVGVIGFGIPAVVSNFYGKYLLQTTGFCLFGMCITWIIPLLLLKVQSVYILTQQKQVSHKTRENEQAPKTTEKLQTKVKV